ncbi:interferon-induced 35 kDa protein isoform X4 [Mirounga angustirostris]|uniref:interferon-induced 35 kDa protein isoform X4 n=1 Tax=Mirounga angustirostris TaxID=9716 RepID=UPI001E68DED3|nr:interferon-induced 35 kDa protein isoform X2 [Mirounga angustirostris]
MSVMYGDATLDALREEQAGLKSRLQELQRRRRELRALPYDQVPFQAPAVPLVFRGHTQQGQEAPKWLVSKVRIGYPLSGGSALVTFNDPKVAQRVLQQKEHEIHIEECRLRVQVRALELPVVTTIQVSTQVSRRSVLVSGFPAGLRLGEEELLDKLEIFFGKTRNGGGDVESRELLRGGVVLGFTEGAVAQYLCRVGQFTVPLGECKCPVRVSPYLSGEIQKAEVSGKVTRGLGRAPACLPAGNLPKDQSPRTPLPSPLPASLASSPLPYPQGYHLPPVPDSQEPLPIPWLLFQIAFRPVPQSVLVLNIPDVLDGSQLQDILETHFQKPSRGGGEVEALRVVPPGQRGLAVFTATSG